MFQSYRVELDDLKCVSHDHLSEVSAAKNEPDLSKLEDLLLKDEPIDVEEITKIIFPEGKPDIFLSHSYSDIKEINNFAKHLSSKKELKVFVDSDVWGSVYKLLKKIDNKFCKNEDGKTYNYDNRNTTTSNTFMMLNSALIKMIDKAEVFLFIGSDNSLSFDGTKKLIDNNKTTFSPWIHSELLFSSMARINVPKRHLSGSILESVQTGTESFEAAKRAPQFIHPAPTEHLKVINSAGLENWLQDTSKGDNALNKLYELTNVNIDFQIK